MRLKACVAFLATTAALGAVQARAQSSAAYDQTCAMCHQKAGAGVPGAFPRLAGRAGALAALPSGRQVMIATVLYGMSGKLMVDKQPLSGMMPAFGSLSDTQIGEALTYVSHLNGAKPRPFTPAEIAAVRGKPPLSPIQVNTLARDPALAKAAP